MFNWRKYYVPGIISLIGIPILAFCYFPKRVNPNYILKVFLPYEMNRNDKQIIEFSKEWFYKSIIHKKVVSVDFNDREEVNKDRLFAEKKSFLIREMEFLKFTGDTSMVLQVKLHNSNTFGDVVWLLNAATKYKIRRWMFADNCFYFVNSIQVENRSVQYIYPTL